MEFCHHQTSEGKFWTWKTEAVVINDFASLNNLEEHDEVKEKRF
jgi:hypothetical protein